MLEHLAAITARPLPVHARPMLHGACMLSCPDLPSTDTPRLRGAAVFVPELSRVGDLATGALWLPFESRFVNVRPARGPAVIASPRSPGSG